jgi:transposase
MQRTLLTKLGLSWISARSKHPKQDKEDIQHQKYIRIQIAADELL